MKLDLKNFEHCNVQGVMHHTEYPEDVFPRLLHDATEEHYKEMNELQTLKSKRILTLRGSNKKSEDNIYSLGIGPNGGANTEIYLSQETEEMREYDRFLDSQLDCNDLQEMQSQQVDKYKASKENKYNEVVGITTETLKLVGEDSEMYMMLVDKLKLVKSEICEVAMAKLQINVGKGKIHSSFTGRSRKRVEKRKRQFWEKK